MHQVIGAERQVAELNQVIHTIDSAALWKVQETQRIALAQHEAAEGKVAALREEVSARAGNIDADELGLIFVSLGHMLPKSELETMIAQYDRTNRDKNEAGRLDLD